MALPGVKTVLQDRFYSITRQDNTQGPRVAAIGVRDTTYDGDTVKVQDYDPYYATFEKDVIREFGEGSQLHKAFLELITGGAQNIYLVAMPSDTVDDDYLDTGPDNVFDTAFDAAETILPNVIVPYGRGSNARDWDDYDGEVTTPGGADQFGFVADNSAGSDSLIIRVGDKCEEISSRSQPTWAVMGVKPWVGGGNSMTTAQVKTHIEFNDLLDRDSIINDNADGENTGYYVSVVATEMRPLGFPNAFGYSNGACHYAAQAANLQANVATTNKKVYNLQGLRYSLNRTQREELIDRALVPIGLNFAREPYWVDGVTFGKSTSDYTRLSTLRIVYAVITMVRVKAEQFIGQPATTENRNAFETAITSGLRQFQLTGGILGSDFIVTYYARSNSATVDLVIQPAFELRNINVNVSIQF